MTKTAKAIMAAAAGVTLLAVSAGPGLAHGMAGRGDTPQMQPAHMGQAYGGPSGAPSYGAAPCPGMRAGMGPGMTMDPGMMRGHGMMGHGMMGHGMMDRGMMGHGMMDRGMMGHGMMDRGMMGHGMMGHGMMGHGSMMGQGMMDRGMMGHGMMGHGSMMGHGMWGGGYGHGPGHGKSAIQADKDLSADDVRGRLERSLKWHGNERLKVGEVKELDDDTIVAEIVTQDDSLVDRFKVDRHTGSMHRTE